MSRTIGLDFVGLFMQKTQNHYPQILFTVRLLRGSCSLLVSLLMGLFRGFRFGAKAGKPPQTAAAYPGGNTRKAPQRL